MAQRKTGFRATKAPIAAETAIPKDEHELSAAEITKESGVDSSETTVTAMKLEFTPTSPKDTDPPGFRAAFNKFLTEEQIAPHNFGRAEQVWRQRWHEQKENVAGVKTLFRISVLRTIDPRTRVGPYLVQTQYPDGLRKGQLAEVPRFVAEHLAEVEAAVNLGAKA